MTEKPYIYALEGWLRKGARKTDRGLHAVTSRRIKVRYLYVVGSQDLLWKVSVDGKPLSRNPIASFNLGSPNAPMTLVQEMALNKGARIDAEVSTPRRKAARGERVALILRGVCH